jgi:hypothetical protein
MLTKRTARCFVTHGTLRLNQLRSNSKKQKATGRASFHMFKIGVTVNGLCKCKIIYPDTVHVRELILL